MDVAVSASAIEGVKGTRRDVPKSQLARKGSARPCTDCVLIFTITCLQLVHWCIGALVHQSVAFVWKRRVGRTGIARQARIRWIMYQRYCSVDRLEASSISRVVIRLDLRCVPLLLAVTVTVTVACIDKQINR